MFNLQQSGTSVLKAGFMTKAWGVLPYRLSSKVVVVSKTYEDEAVTYMKSDDGYIFIMIKSRYFEDQNVTFLDASVIIQPKGGYIRFQVAKQLAVSILQSITNFETFANEELANFSGDMDEVKINSQFEKALRAIKVKKSNDAKSNKVTQNGEISSKSYDISNQTNNKRTVGQKFDIEEEVVLEETLKESVNAEFTSDDEEQAEVIISQDAQTGQQMTKSAPKKGNESHRQNEDWRKL